MKTDVWIVVIVMLAGFAIWQSVPVWNVEPTPQVRVDASGRSDEPRVETRREPPSMPFEQVAPRGAVDPTIEARSRVDDHQLLMTEAAPRSRHGDGLPSNLVIAIRNFLDAPLAGVRVTLQPGSRDRRTGVTGGNGEVSFDHLAAGRYTYRVKAPGQPQLRAAAALELAAGEMRRLELQIADRERSILGQVLDQQGTPVGGLEVKAQLYRPARDGTLLMPRSQAEQRDETGANGSFEISELQDGEYEVRTVAGDDYGSAKAIVRAGADAVLLTVPKRAELRVFGQVASGAGELLPGVSVAQFGSPGRRTRTDEEGRYELLVTAGDGSGLAGITFRAEGYLAERGDVSASEGAGLAELRVDAKLEPVGQTAAVQGHLLDERYEPVAGEHVYLYSPRLRTHYQAVSSPDGTVVFPAVAARPDYPVRVSPHGPCKGYTKAALDLSADTSGLEIVLETLALGKLSGRMVDVTGAPVAGFSLRLISADAPARWREVRGDAEGYFQVDEVPEGEPDLQTASAPKLRIAGVWVDAQAEADVDLVLDWGTAALDGRVVDAKWPGGRGRACRSVLAARARQDDQPQRADDRDRRHRQLPVLTARAGRNALASGACRQRRLGSADARSPAITGRRPAQPDGQRRAPTKRTINRLAFRRFAKCSCYDVRLASLSPAGAASTSSAASEHGDRLTLQDTSWHAGQDWFCG